MAQLLDTPASESEEEAGGYLTRVFRATEEANRIAVMKALPQCPGGSLLDIGTHRGDFTVRVAEHHGLAKRSLRGVGYYPLGPRAARIAARIDPLHAAFLVATFTRA